MIDENFPLPALALIVAGLVLGLSLLGVGIKKYIVSQESKSWPSVKGVVVSSSMRVDQHDIEVEQYHAHVSYEYVVDAKEFYSRKEYLLQKAEAKSYVEKYPEGSEIDVFYQPDNPKITMLEPGTQKGWTLMFVGLFFSLLSASMLVFAIK